MFSHFFSVLILSHLIVALPIPKPRSILGLDDLFGTEASGESTNTSPLSTEQVDAALLRPALFTRASYCSSAAVTGFACGPQCDALGGGVEVLLAGGDDGLVPNFFVAHDSQTQSIVVAHQGTSKSSILSILNDAQIAQVKLNPARVPNQPEGVEVHDGFQDTFERTADQILATVQKGLSDKGINKVLITGHSLGAAIAVLDAMMLKAVLPASTEITTTVFGLPRVGNAEWASFVSSTLGNTFSYVTNQKDPVPNLPPTLLQYMHSAGEVHIVTAGLQPGDVEEVVSCEGAENQACSAGVSLLDVSFSDHNGPYIDGIGFGGKNCPA